VPLDAVQQAAGGGNHDLAAAAQFRALLLDRLAAHDGGRPFGVVYWFGLVWFWFGVVGYLIVVCISRRQTRAALADFRAQIKKQAHAPKAHVKSV
jgi:hypothetical protein